MGRYTNQLNDALLLKRGNEFWKCGNSTFSSGAGQCKQVDVSQTTGKLLKIFINTLLLLVHLFKTICNVTMNILVLTILVHYVYRSIVLMLN